MPLPRSGSGLPPWRRQVLPWIMAGARLGAAWLVTQWQLHALLQQASLLHGRVGAPTRFAIAALLAAGTLLFAWPRGYLVGFALLVAGLGAFEWLWHPLGVPGGALLGWSVAILAVLAVGEWLTQRIQRHLYGTD
jgi:hypothetical protein